MHIFSSHLRKVSFIGVLALVGLILASVIPLAARAAGNEPSSQVFLAVQFGPYDHAVRSVSFSGSSITGLDALLQSGLQVETHSYGWGTAVCSIEGVGCPASNCFCDPNNFWNYEYWDGSQWQGHLQGAGDTPRNDGDVDGWRWGEWNGSAIPPWGKLLQAWESLGWLRTQQQADGGFGNMGSSIESALALGANHERAQDWVQTGSSTSLEDYLLANAVTYSQQSAASAGKLAVALTRSGVSYPGGASTPMDYYDSLTGSMGAGAGPQSWAILGTVALSQTVPIDAIDYLKNLALSSGGWEWSPGWGADTNTTSLAIRALLAAGESPSLPEIQSAISFLQEAQNMNGGFPYDPQSMWGTDSDANSTAYVLQAIYALEGDPYSAEWRESVPTALDFLDCRRLTDGSFEWMAGSGSNLFATQQAIPALFGRPVPSSPHPVTICSVLFYPILSK